MSWGVIGGWGMMDLEGWRKGPWTCEEDRLLIDYVRLHGEGRWNSVARLSGLKRNGKSCRLRWVNYLRPDLKRGQITSHEESIILELHARWGNRWSTIARSLPGRTDNEIKNYWRTHFKKKAKAASDSSERAKIRFLKRQQFQQQQQQLHVMQQEKELSYELDMKRFMSMMEENKSYNTNYYKTATMPQVGIVMRPASDMSTSTTVHSLSASSHDQEEQLSYFNSMINSSSSNVSSSSAAAETLNEDMIMWDGFWNLDDVNANNFSAANRANFSI